MDAFKGKTMRAVRVKGPIPSLDCDNLEELLVVEEVPIPLPKHGQVLVKVHAFPANPSDLGGIVGRYDSSSAEEFPFQIGFEGSGEVVLSGGGIGGWLVKGKRVAFSSKHVWAEYAVVNSVTCTSIPSSLSFVDACSAFVNPLTVVAFVEIAKSRKQKAIVHTAGASVLGRMLVRYGRENGVSVIAVVRKEEQVNILKAIDEDVAVVNTGEEGWKETFKAKCELAECRLAFDAVGGELTGDLVSLMPDGSEVQVYGGLSNKPVAGVPITDLIFKGKKVTGFWLRTFLDSKGSIAKLSMLKKVSNNLAGSLSTEISSVYEMGDLIPGIRNYLQSMSQGKSVFCPWGVEAGKMVPAQSTDRKLKRSASKKLSPVEEALALYSQFNLGPLFMTPALTPSSDAQINTLMEKAFGFLLNFAHEEAMKIFTVVIEADPKRAFAYWGRSYAVGTHYNWVPGFGSGYDDAQTCLKLLEEGKATEEGSGLSELEEDLIVALSKRYSAEARDAADPKNGSYGCSRELNIAFAEAMGEVYEKHKGNKTNNIHRDVTALYAEALMNLSPWEFWKKEEGSNKTVPANENTLRIKEILENALDESKDHPGLCHLYIHLMELSGVPEKASPAADALRMVCPDSGHLTHMPSHIDMWLGDYQEVIACNERAVAADEKYVSLTQSESCFYKAYRMHNIHFVVWASLFDGQSAKALEYARMAEGWLQEGDESSGVKFILGAHTPVGPIFLEAYHSLKWHTFVRFGLWDQALSEPIQEKKDVFPVAIASAHYARGIAYASTNRVEEAEKEQELFLEMLAHPAMEGRRLFNNFLWSTEKPCILGVAKTMLEGEIAYRKGDYENAFSILRTAVEKDQGLHYDEPWGWMTPARHALGALLLEQDHVAEAREVYLADLEQYKDNMWSLLGLLNCLKAEGKTDGDEFKDLSAKYEKASARADMKIEHTCFCAGVGK